MPNEWGRNGIKKIMGIVANSLLNKINIFLLNLIFFEAFEKFDTVLSLPFPFLDKN